MAWIVKLHPHRATPNPAGRSAIGTVPPSAPPASPPTKSEACSVKRALERGGHVAYSDQLSPEQGSMLFGEYVTTIWWPAWKPTHPRSAQGTSKLTARILPRFGDLPLAQLDAHAIAAWQHDLTREGLSPHHRDLPVAACVLVSFANAATWAAGASVWGPATALPRFWSHEPEAAVRGRRREAVWWRAAGRDCRLR